MYEKYFFFMKDSLKKLNTGEKTFLGREKRLFTKENIFFLIKLFLFVTFLLRNHPTVLASYSKVWYYRREPYC